MKLNKHQKHYQYFFKFIKSMYSNYTNPKFDNDPFQYTSSPNKCTKKYAKTLNSQILFIEGSHTQTKLSPTKKCPRTIDIQFILDDVQCLITFGQYDLWSMYVGYNHDTYPMDKTFSTHNSTVPCFNLWANKKIEFFNSSNQPLLVHNEIIQDKEYSEEEIFQLSTIIDNPEIYIKAYKKMIQVRNAIHSSTKNITIMKLLQIVNEKV